MRILPILIVGLCCNYIAAQELTPIIHNPLVENAYLKLLPPSSNPFSQPVNQPVNQPVSQPVTLRSNNDPADCDIEEEGKIYVDFGAPITLEAEIDTFLLDTFPGEYSCVGCDQLQYGEVVLDREKFTYTVGEMTTGGLDTFSIQFCNINGCESQHFQIVARQAGQSFFFPSVDIEPLGGVTIEIDSAFLPGNIVCKYFLDCEDDYDGVDQRLTFINDGLNPVAFEYQASRFGGLDSVCVVICDDFGICNTFRYAFSIPQVSITIPFMDDFSRKGPYPQENLWLDRSVFVNETMANTPPSVGVATFDGLNERGSPHGDDYGISDRLTSNYLDLTGLSPGTVFLTYWVQRGGKVDKPEPQDSLIVQFKQANGAWQTIRALEGIPINQPNSVPEPFRFYRDSLPLEYYYEDFQFRFLNYSNRTGLLDTWHLDYVRLDDQLNDTIINDLTFIDRPLSILRDYTSLPWRHFNESPDTLLRQNLEVGVQNFSTQILNARINNVSLIEQNSGVNLFGTNGATLFNGEEANFAPFSATFKDYPLIGDAATGFPALWPDYLQVMGGPLFNQTDRPTFILSYSLENGSQLDREGYESIMVNDRVERETVFDEFFSYADETAEAGFVVQRGNAAAVRFTALVNDSLRAVQFHFPHTSTDISNQRFDLKVWLDDPDTAPVYEAFSLTPYYSSSFFDTLQGYTTFVLEDEFGEPAPVFLPAGTDFYVGWEQVSNCGGLRCIPIGYDKNSTTGKQFIRVNVNGVWEPLDSFFPQGALMLRAVVGDETPPPTVSDTDDQYVYHDLVKIFPNPSTGIFNVLSVKGQPLSHYDYQLTSQLGTLLESGQMKEILNLSHLPAGIYYLRMGQNEKLVQQMERIIIID